MYNILLVLGIVLAILVLLLLVFAYQGRKLVLQAREDRLGSSGKRIHSCPRMLEEAIQSRSSETA